MKEKLKSFVLIVLMISAITMFMIIFNTTNEESFLEEVNKDISCIRPQNYVFSFGDLFIKLYDLGEIDLCSSTVDIMKNLSVKKIKPIDSDIYLKNYSRSNIVLNYSLLYNFEEFYSFLNEKEELKERYNDIYFDSILFLLNEKKIYLRDSVNEKHYEMQLKFAEKWINEIYDKVDKIKNKKLEYKSIEDRYKLTSIGLKDYKNLKSNMTLTPLFDDMDFTEYKVIKVDNLLVDDNLDLLIYRLFLDDVNNLKKLQYEDGSLSYIYGYGREILSVDKFGNVEYTDNSAEKEKFVSLFSKLILMGKYMDIFKMNKNSLILDDVLIKGETEIYLFKYVINGVELENHIPLEFRFKSDELEYIRCEKPLVFEKNIYEPFSEDIRIEKILLKNRIEIEKNFLEDNKNLEIKDSDLFQMCIQNIDSYEMKYYNTKTKLIPVIYAKISDTKYIIDIKTNFILQEEKAWIGKE